MYICDVCVGACASPLSLGVSYEIGLCWVTCCSITLATGHLSLQLGSTFHWKLIALWLPSIHLVHECSW